MLQTLITLSLVILSTQVYGDTKLSPGLHIEKIDTDAYVATDTEYFRSRVLIVKMKDSSVVIASSPFENENTRALISWIKKTLKPQRLVAINTHFHDDGTGGNEIYSENNAEIWASDLTVKLQTQKSRIESHKKASFIENNTLRKRLVATKIVPANHQFELKKGKTLQFGKEAVQIYFPGHAHSPDNVVVFFKNKRILFGGCIIKPKSLGYLGVADVENWSAATKNLLRFRPKIVVPGHDKWGGKELLEKTIEVAKKAIRKEPPSASRKE